MLLALFYLILLRQAGITPSAPEISPIPSGHVYTTVKLKSTQTKCHMAVFSTKLCVISPSFHICSCHLFQLLAFHCQAALLLLLKGLHEQQLLPDPPPAPQEPQGGPDTEPGPGPGLDLNDASK